MASQIIHHQKPLESIGYADPDRWSKPIPTGREGEYLAIYTRRYAPTADQAPPLAIALPSPN